MTGELKIAYTELLNRRPWEWFVSIHLPGKFYQPFMKKIREAFRDENGGQVGYSGIFVGGGGHAPHVHSLWVGRFPGSRTLRDIDRHYWHDRIGEIIKNHSGVLVKPVYSVDVIGYLFLPRNSPSDDVEWFSWGRLVARR